MYWSLHSLQTLCMVFFWSRGSLCMPLYGNCWQYYGDLGNFENLAKESCYDETFHIVYVLFQASDREVIWMMRVGIILVGVAATLMAITVESIYGLWYLCSDLCFVVLFPQLLCVVYFRWANIYGALAGFLVGSVLRLAGGENLIGIPALIKYPFYDYDTQTQYFPHKTLAMVISLLCILVGSSLARWIYSFFVPKEQLDYFLLNRVSRPISPDTKEKLEVDYIASDKISSLWCFVKMNPVRMWPHQ